MLCCAPLGLVRAQSSLDNSAPAQPQAQSSDESASPVSEPHWLEKIADLIGHGTPQFARGHAKVLGAFRESVAAPAKATVRVWCDGRQVALGTIVDSTGLIVTKASELTSAATCELHDGSRHPAEVVGTDHGSDLALLRIAQEDLPTIVWSEQDPPSLGGWVVTPGLVELPVAIGIVSVAPHRVRGGVLGIQMTEDDLGPRITFVVPGSGAAVAGLAPGDIITHVDEKPIATSDDMIATTSNRLPDDTLQLQILRDGEKRRVIATLGSVSDTLTSRRAQFQERLGTPLSRRRFLFPLALEHDSVLAPNQCGGVLVNLDGEAIGINVARASRISCYAIPASVALPILKSLQTNAAEAVTSPVAARAPGANRVETTTASASK
jgi:serine protease Do